MRISNQRTQARITRANVCPGEFCARKKLIHRVEYIFNVIWLDAHRFRETIVISVGSANDRPLAPGNNKEDALLFSDDNRVRSRNARRLENEMDPFGESQLDVAVAQPLRPWPSGVGDGPRPNCHRGICQLVSDL